MPTIDRPNLLIVSNLTHSAEHTRAALSELASRTQKFGDDPVVNQGLFVLAVSYVESMLNDTLKYYLSVFPQKLNRQSLNATMEDLLSNQFDLVEAQIEKFLHSLAYKPIHEIVTYFCQALSLDADADRLVRPLREIKATRNILLHNRLVTNSVYVEQAGEFRRTSELRQKLSVDAAYLSSSIATMAQFVDELIRLMREKYRTYTKAQAIKRLWAFTFDSPILPFGDFWDVDKERDRIYSRENPHENRLSYSEKAFLNVWRVHFSGRTCGHAPFTMHAFDEHNQAKLLYLLSVFRHFSIQ